jgi:hypothetical protein
MYEYENSKAVEVIIRRGRRKSEKNGGDKQIHGTFVCMYGNVITKPLYNPCILIKMF